MAQRDNLARTRDDELKAANDANYDDGQGAAAANDPYYSDSPVAREALAERQATKTVQGDFASKGIAARAYRKQGKREEAATNETEQVAEVTRQRDEMLHRMATAVQSQMHQIALKRAAAKITSRAAVAGASRSAFGWLLSIMVTVYVWQFVFATISLVGFGGQAIVESVLEDTWYGRAINFVVGFIVDLKNLFPFEHLALAAWMIVFLLSMATVIGLLLWFTLRGKSILHSTVSTIISFVCISLNILPLTNLFPWLLLWALYIEMMTPSKPPLFSAT